MDFNNVDDNEVLKKIAASAKNEKKCTLEVLEYLAEVNKRRLDLKEGYSSLHDFCMRFLKYSEGEANRRVHAARALWKFEEEIRPALQNEEITLTGLCLLSRHLTRENIKPILNETKNQSTRTVEKIIQKHCPEAKKKVKTLIIILDEEFEELLEKAKIKYSEKMPEILLKRLLKEVTKDRNTKKSEVKKHTRYVQVNLKREVKKKANFRCSYQAPSGVRCNQTAHLEIDHIRPYAMGGSSRELVNLRVLCKAHNLMKARIDFPDFKISRDIRA